MFSSKFVAPVNSLPCLNTNECNSSKTFVNSSVGCCDGFTGNAAATDKEYFSKYYGYPGKPTKKTLKKEGCPRGSLHDNQACNS